MTPERLARLLGWLIPPRYRAEVIDDLLDEAAALSTRHSSSVVCIWLFGHIVRSAAAARRRSLEPFAPAALPSVATWIVSDAAFACRLFIREPLFTIVAVLTLAIGIGSTTAMYSLARSTVLRPVDVAEPASLYEISENVTYPAFERYARLTDVFEHVTAWATLPVSLGLPGNGLTTSAAFVSGDYFAALGVGAGAGRTLAPADDRPGIPPVAVVGHALWQRAFGGDPSIVGRTIRVNAREVLVIGVAREGFRGTRLDIVPDLWLPLQTAREVRTGAMARVALFEGSDVFWLRVLVRLRNGIPFDRADAELRAARADRPGPQSRFTTAPLVPLNAIAAGFGNSSTLARFMLLLAIVAGCALLTACANLASLLVARGLGRTREFAVRTAVGASRARLVSQLLTESFVLAVAGGLAGLFVAGVSLDLFSAFELPGGVAVRALGLGIDGGIATAAMVITLATGLLFGVLPAMSSTRRGAAAALRSVRATAPGGARFLLLAGQVALCTLLLGGAALFFGSMQRALAIDTGVDAAHVALAAVDLGRERYSPAGAGQFYESVRERLRRTPGVRAAAWTTVAPFDRAWNPWFEFADTRPPRGDGASIDLTCVGPEYFDAVGIPLIAGRAFTAGDGASAPHVAVVNESFGRQFFGGGTGLGERIRVGEEFRRALAIGDTWVRIVGVVRDSRHRGIGEPTAPLVYFPRAQVFDTVALEHAVLVARADDVGAALRSMRGALSGLDARLPVSLGPLHDDIDRALLPQRLGLAVLGLLGCTALALSSVGIYGACAFNVSQRRREIGIRRALGAGGSRIHRLVTGQSLLAVAVGAAAGITAVAVAGRFVAAFLFGMSPADPRALGAAAAAAVAAAVLASVAPARRALAIDPAEALRAD